ncbi:MAG: hypothetical protein JNK79_19855 [Chitinophagaceae bacterium]|nr:hypothetical protein [Chitinophagaceae bacterium]
MKVLTTILSILISITLQAQVNGYAQVTAISSTTLTIGATNETYGTFSTGTPVVIMQMQDNVIGSNTSNNSSFGTLSSIQSTGQYEVAHIVGTVRSSGTLTQVVISSPLAHTYNFNSNSNVQVITYPSLGTNYTTTSDISAVPWNGSVGGVVAFRVTGTLTLNHNITADNAGFRGAAANAGDAGSCVSSTYITSSNEYNANKGESIYKVANASFAAGRGRILNGGGGANSHNGGGGGGSNASAGGDGGRGYGCSSSAGGLGGATLYTLIGGNRAFMGGGGGAGEGNNNFNTAGGNGGGVILINANQVVTTGSGSSLRISANGQTASDVGNDGAGGGGAGGAVLLMVNSWNIASTKTLTISANGGNGGNVTDNNAHGGGGGGGQGAVIFSTSTPATNITTRTLNGAGGRNYAGGTFADNGAGADNLGIFNGSFALLPAKIISFKVKRAAQSNELSWEMVNEAGVSYYEIQRSYDGLTYENIKRVMGGSSLYEFSDDFTRDANAYYRIAIHNNNGRVEYSNVVMIKTQNNSAISVSLAPNPVQDFTSLKIETEHASTGTVRLINSFGMLVSVKNINLSKGGNKIIIDIPSQLQNGTYQLVVNAGEVCTSVKMLVNR